MDLNSASFKLTAVDATADAFNSVTNRLEGMKGSFAGLGTAVAGLAAAAGIGVFANMIANTISANAELERLAEKTGASVEALSGLRSIAKITGTDMDSIATAIGKLDKTMLAAAQSGGAAAQTFATLGVNVKDAAGALRDPDAVLLDIAKKFDDLGSGAERAALAQQLFGKAGIQMIPVLQELAIVGDYQVKVTEQQALLAEDLVRSWTKLGAQGNAVKQIIANEVTGALDALARSFLNVFNQTGGLTAKIKELADSGELAAWARKAGTIMAELADAFVDVIHFVGALYESVKAVSPVLGDFGTIMLGVSQIMTGDLSGGMESLSAGWAGLKTDGAAVTKVWQDAKLGSHDFRDEYEKQLIVLDTTPEKAHNAQHAIEDLTKAHQAADNVLRDFIDSLGKEGAKLDAIIASLELYGQKTKETQLAVVQFELAHGKLGERLALLAVTFPALAQAVRDEALAQAAGNDQKRTLIDLLEKSAEAYNKYVDSLVSGVTSLEKSLKAEQDRNVQFGLTRAQIEELLIVEEQQRLALLQETDADQLTIQASKDRLAILVQTRDEMAKGDALQQQLSLWKSVEEAGHDAFMHIFDTGTSVFKRLTDALKNGLLELLYQMTVKKWVIQIATDSSSAGVGGALSNAIGGGGASGGANSIGSLVSAGSSIAGLLGGSSAAFGAAAGAGMAAGAETIGVAASAGAAAVGGMAAVAGAVATFIPVVGAVVAIGYLLYNYLEGKKGGPKEGGFASSSGTAGLDVDANSRFYTPNNADQVLSTAVSTISQSYSDSIKALGGTAGAVTFGLGYDSDPKGKADNRVSAGASLNGVSVYDQRNLDVGKDSATLQAALTTESPRALLAALQASDLPTSIAKLLKGLNAATATDDQIKNILAMGQAYKGLLDITSKLPAAVSADLESVLDGTTDTFNKVAEMATAIANVQDVLNADPIADSLDAIAASAQTAYTTFQKQGAALQQLRQSFDDSTSAATGLASATVSYYNAQVQLLAQIQQVKTAVSAMFGDTIRSLTLTTLDNSGKYNFLQKEADQLRDALLKSNDPTQINDYAKRINDDINQAFGLLSAGDQKQHLQDFVDRINQLNDAVNKQLTGAGVAAQNDAATTLKQIQTDLAKAAADMAASAAASKVATATPLKLEVDVHVDAPATATVNG